ncbi:DUF4282 domain-containing protein [Francisellaceae bacterium CB299]|jgi:hypothetical protein
MNETIENPALTFLKKFISFNDFITPSIIVFIFWLSLVGISLSGIVAIFFGNFIYGIIEIIFGAVFTKVFCEMLIVLFKINENLKEIAKNTQK